jgi:hypothetical protein
MRSMRARLAVHWSLPFAVFLAVAEVVRNWGDWGFWPFWVVDYVAVTLLGWGWWAHRRGDSRAGRILAGAWGFACAMFYMSFFSHLYTIAQPDHGPLNHRLLTALVGVFFALTIVGFVSSVAAGSVEVDDQQRIQLMKRNSL